MLLSLGILHGQQTKILYKSIGKVQPRMSTDIVSNNWAIGAETMDRDLVDFYSWKDHLKQLGAKKIRLQAGWAKCEKEKGVYDFKWLDEIIDYVISQGVEPWLQTSYGNPIYEGGGGIHLSAGLPTSEEGLEAWDNWVRTMVKRYNGRVKIWEIWNEPENKGNNSSEEYAKFYLRTAENIRSVDPAARLYALSLGNVKEVGVQYVDTLLKMLKEQVKLSLVDEITLHGYTYNPKDVYEHYEKINRTIKKYSNIIKIRQGELGCPSENQSIYALKYYDWTELSQSKWVLRKMMGDLGHDIPSSYFLIIDIVYTHNHERIMETPKRNTKGLIKSDLKRQFVAYKPSYNSYQNVTSIFDHSLERIPNYPFLVGNKTSLSVFGYENKNFGQQAVAIWMDGETPTNINTKTPITFEFSDGNFETPVYVDLRTGEVYEIPKTDWKKEGTNYTFKKIPIYDSPILIADKSLILLTD